MMDTTHSSISTPNNNGKNLNKAVSSVSVASSTSAHHHNVMTADPIALLDKIDCTTNRGVGLATSSINHNSSESTNNANSSSNSSSNFDPIEFLNTHYQTESSLLSALPALRHTTQTRIQSLDESISTTIQQQSDLADLTLSDVSRAKHSIQQLTQRIQTVQSKARLSEAAVQEITRDMKRLDYAKKHLSKTITALKRLHMLIHAVTQLKYCVEVGVPGATTAIKGGGSRSPFVDYRGAANLMDASRLLLGHFEGYMASVEKMRILKETVDKMRDELEEGICFGFRVVGFGVQNALEKREHDREGARGGNNKKNMARNSKHQKKKTSPHKPPIKRSAAYDKLEDDDLTNDDDGKNLHDSEQKQDTPEQTSQIIPMPPEVLSDACLALSSISPNAKPNFIKTFCNDHLDAYNQLFNPKNNTSSAGGASSSSEDTVKASFKIQIPNVSTNDDITSGTSTKEQTLTANPNPASLDQVERRYAWYRRMLKEQFEDKFPSVFPPSFNMHYHLTFAFLTLTSEHILLLLSKENTSGSSTGNKKDKKDTQQQQQSNPYKDRDAENVTVLLKALQKTMLFEKEMTAWLQREYNTIFIDEGKQQANGADESNHGQINVLGEDGEPLEFDVNGKAVSANSAEGIRIKYERKMKDRKKQEAAQNNHDGGRVDESGEENNALNNMGMTEREREGRISTPVKPLIGVASTAFDKFMGPYIQLEEQNMDEMLVESTSDKTVDTRGELPVFTSSTALFVYIKNSITRCTVLTRGKTLFLLYMAFQDTLRKYAQVLSGKYPNALSGPAAALSGINLSLPGGGVVNKSPSTSGLAGDVNAVYRIPPGEETTICHAIDTCEYCSDTVEALQDLITDKIEEKFKAKIDMSNEQEAFHDVTAKGIRVLVSGLAQRTEMAFKVMSNMNWGTMNVVGEESSYVRSIHDVIQPFVITVKGLLPNSYFRNFCDKFAATFTSTFYNTIVKCKRISESGTQQLLLDVYNIKTLMLKLPVLETLKSPNNTLSPTAPGGTTIAPAMYTKMVTKEFQRIETLLKLVGTPGDLLTDVFRNQWSSGSALDLQTIMNLKGMKRTEQAAMFEKFGVDPATAMKGAATGASGTTMTENIQALQDRSSDVAAKVNSDLNQMRLKVEDFRKAFR